MLAIFALMKTKVIEITAVVALLLGAYLYIRISHAEVAALHAQVAAITKQADDLQAANTETTRQLGILSQTQQAVAAQMQDARTKAAVSTKTVRALNIHKAASADPKALEGQINQTWAAQGQQIEDASNAH